MQLQKLKNRNDIITKKIGSEVLLYDPNTEKVHVLNSTSHFIWENMDGNHSLDDIQKLVQKKFNITDSNQVQQDIKKAIELFDEMDLLDPESSV